ncbi:hypothetical protein AB8O38_05710 [Saccharomonospora xinjiangensis]|uniref:hypothetical protein n=1 Tax=Saccharomonospora xinjiangensis TaxID=75294 RepID=UPI0035102D9F
MPNDGEITASLLATVEAPLEPGSADAPQVLHGPGSRVLVQRGDTELVVRDLDGERRQIRFPAPWPRRYGSVAVAPGGDLAVFAGVHALRAVEPTGAVRWEIRHGCWSAAVCTETHSSFSEYAEDPGHDYAERGSAAFSPDGSLLWAHVRSAAREETEEEWLVLDSTDGTVLGRAATDTVGSGSIHFPHPDSAYMGLTILGGEENSPVLWGHWDGATVTIRRFDEEVLLDVSPSGEYFVTTDPGQWSLYLHPVAEDGGGSRSLGAEQVVSGSDGGAADRERWEYEAAFPYDDTVVAGFEGVNAGHWLVEPRTMSVRGRLGYPFPVPGAPRSAGPGAWYTVSEDGASVHLWTLPREQQA